MHSLRFACRVVTLSAVAAGCCAIGCRSAPAPAAKAVSADTWASVDGREITRDAVEKAYRRSRDSSQTPSDEEALTAKLGILDELIMQDLLQAKAREQKIELSESEIDAAYAEARKNIPDDAFQRELARRNVAAADMRDGLRRQLLSQKVIDANIGSKIAPTDEEVTRFFNANRAQF